MGKKRIIKWIFLSIILVLLAVGITKYVGYHKFIKSFAAGMPPGKFSLHGPRLVVVKNNNIYVNDPYYNYRIQKFSLDGKLLRIIGGYENEDFKSLAISLFTIDHSGNIYIAADSKDKIIKKFDRNGNFLYTLKNESQEEINVTGMAVDSNDNLYIMDGKSRKMWIVKKGEDYINEFAKNEKFPKQVIAYSKQLAIDSKDNLLLTDNIILTDYHNSRIQKRDSQGRLLLTFGSLGENEGQFIYTSAIAIDNDNNIYVADRGNNRIQRFNSKGEFIEIIKMKLDRPSDIAVDSAGNLYVIDIERIDKKMGDITQLRKFDKQGNFLLKFGESSKK